MCEHSVPVLCKQPPGTLRQIGILKDTTTKHYIPALHRLGHRENPPGESVVEFRSHTGHV